MTFLVVLRNVDFMTGILHRKSLGNKVVDLYGPMKLIKSVGSQIRYATKDTSTDSEYVEFTGQIWAALFFDAFAFLVAILSAVYVAFFKNWGFVYI